MAWHVLLAFGRLGLSSFGGPVAHIVSFRREFVERRDWITEAQFAQLLVLTQALPGPASSQMGFAIGLLRAGWPGALAAFVGFTAPSALLMFAFALWLPGLSGPIAAAGLHGLKLVALAAVAYGLVGMSRSLCPDAPRRLIALLAALIVLTLGQAWVQSLVVALGAVAGVVLCRGVRPLPGGEFALRYGPATAVVLLAVFCVLLLALPLLGAAHGGLPAYAGAFYRTGALAFGGGHVVLPLLQDAVVQPGWVAQANFLAGYGTAQAMPGPLFTIAAYLGARLPGVGNAALASATCLAAIFLPGFLVLGAALPLWRRLAAHPLAVRAVAGISAVAVGLLAAALYDPLWLGAVHSAVDVLIAALAVTVLARWRTSALWVVVLCIALSIAAALV